MEKVLTGIGVLIQTPQGTFLFQERDKNIERNPGMITPFGGGIEKNETPTACVLRELQEELDFKIDEKELKNIGNFESHFARGTYIQMYLIENVNPKELVLHEGKSIAEMSITEALHHANVTDFTKEVLTAIEKKGKKGTVKNNS